MVLVAAYVILSFPYMYRAVDTGLAAIDIRSLTEAAQSLGAGWARILWRVIFPNLRTAILSGAFLTLAIVMGEYTIATFLARTRPSGPTSRPRPDKAVQAGRRLAHQLRADLDRHGRDRLLGRGSRTSDPGRRSDPLTLHDRRTPRMSYLTLTDVQKRFGEFVAVEDFNLSAEKGEFVSFLGPSAAARRRRSG